MYSMRVRFPAVMVELVISYQRSQSRGLTQGVAAIFESVRRIHSYRLHQTQTSTVRHGLRWTVRRVCQRSVSGGHNLRGSHFTDPLTTAMVGGGHSSCNCRFLRSRWHLPPGTCITLRRYVRDTICLCHADLRLVCLSGAGCERQRYTQEHGLRREFLSSWRCQSLLRQRCLACSD